MRIGRALKTSFHIIAPINRQTIMKTAVNEGVDESELSERFIHDAYASLYTLEHRLTQAGVKVDIRAIVMSFPEDLIREIKRTNCKIVFVAGRMDASTIDALYSNLSTPILLIPSEE